MSFISDPLLWGVQIIKYGREEAMIILSRLCVINWVIYRSKIKSKQNAVSRQRWKQQHIELIWIIFVAKNIKIVKGISKTYLLKGKSSLKWLPWQHQDRLQRRLTGNSESTTIESSSIPKSGFVLEIPIKKNYGGWQPLQLRLFTNPYFFFREIVDVDRLVRRVFILVFWWVRSWIESKMPIGRAGKGHSGWKRILRL